jgi:hypothetical protein
MMAIFAEFVDFFPLVVSVMVHRQSPLEIFDDSLIGTGKTRLDTF